MLLDSFERQIRYLRVSVTDLCNLRCRYCMPEKGVTKLGHKEILSYEELHVLIRAAASLGVTKVRLTGGEPLIRKGVVDFIQGLSEIENLKNLRVTTNGVLLNGMANQLVSAGIRQVNVSLDSLSPEKFAYITGRNLWDRVWSGIQTALGAGFAKVKINCVALRGFNDDELVDIARLATRYPLDVRFIEFMPMGLLDFWSPEKLIPVAELRNLLAGEFGDLVPVAARDGDGPARVYQIPGAPGRLGFISPVTDHFCASCNRIRLTADGKLRLCLLSDQEIDLKIPLRSGASIEELSEIIGKAVLLKPMSHTVEESGGHGPRRAMNKVGG